MKIFIKLEKDSRWDQLTGPELKAVRKQSRRLLIFMAQKLNLGNNDMLSCIVKKNVTTRKYKRIGLSLTWHLQNNRIFIQNIIRFVPNQRKFLIAGTWRSFKSLVAYCAGLFQRGLQRALFEFKLASMKHPEFN